METTAAKPKVKWAIDPAHSELAFKVKHMMITNVKGEFKNFTVDIDGDDLMNSPITVSIDAGSIFTKEDQRDGHLRSADFFDTDKFPGITFKSTSFKKKDGDKHVLKGLLTIKDVTREVALDVEFGGISKDPWGKEKAGFSLEGKIKRSEFGLTWNAALETGGVLVSDEVKIYADVQFAKVS